MIYRVVITEYYVDFGGDPSRVMIFGESAG